MIWIVEWIRVDVFDRSTVVVVDYFECNEFIVSLRRAWMAWTAKRIKYYFICRRHSLWMDWKRAKTAYIHFPFVSSDYDDLTFNSIALSVSLHATPNERLIRQRQDKHELGAEISLWIGSPPANVPKSTWAWKKIKCLGSCPVTLDDSPYRKLWQLYIWWIFFVPMLPLGLVETGPHGIRHTIYCIDGSG